MNFLNRNLLLIMPMKIKKKLKKPLKSGGIGRPAGNWDSKRIQYLKMLKDGKIKEPKASTLEFYKIIKDGDKYEFLDD